MTVACDTSPRNIGPLDRSLFGRLHAQGRRLITAWAGRGMAVPDSADASAYFEGFIYVWFALNRWGSCVTGTDTDSVWVARVAGDRELAGLFSKSLQDDYAAAASVEQFAQLWPIFKSSEIRRRGIWVPDNYTRQRRVEAYLREDITFEPSCWSAHHPQRAPADWGHTLKVLYRVRCNLFHGEKTLDSENDRKIVAGAYPVLVHIIRLLDLIQ